MDERKREELISRVDDVYNDTDDHEVQNLAGVVRELVTDRSFEHVVVGPNDRLIVRLPDASPEMLEGTVRELQRALGHNRFTVFVGEVEFTLGKDRSEHAEHA